MANDQKGSLHEVWFNETTDLYIRQIVKNSFESDQTPMDEADVVNEAVKFFYNAIYGRENEE